MNLNLNVQKIDLKTFGNSMLPFYKDGDVLTIKKIVFYKIGVNDLIAFKKNGVFTTHRVIYKASKFLITKGDNNYYNDGKVYPKQVLGKIIQVKRGLKKINPEDIYYLQSKIYLNEIIKVTSIFNIKKIQYVFLKGLPIHLYYEKTFPRRYYADCDILVSQKDLTSIDKILRKSGFKREYKHKYNTIYEIKKYVEISYITYSNNFPIVFDVHLEPAFLTYEKSKFNDIYSQKKIEAITQMFFENKKKVKFKNNFFFILHPSHQIVYLALHNFHHNNKGIHQLNLLHVILNYYSHKKIKIICELHYLINNYHIGGYIFPSFYFIYKYYKNKFAKDIMMNILLSPLQKFVINTITKQSVFDGDDIRFTNIKHFLYLFLLSESPFYQKILVFIRPPIIRSLIDNLINFIASCFKSMSFKSLM